MDETEREGIFAYLGRIVRGLFRGAQHLISDQLRAAAREPALFLGVALLLIGLMSFETARYCDGNTAQYLSCTRSAPYYYYDALDRVSAVLGALFILGWYSRR